MSLMSSTVKKSPEPRGAKKYFTLAEARRALPLVRRVALDLQEAARWTNWKRWRASSRS
jgi:hypothetical protein